MLMVCPNCQSTDVIKVQDEYFCTNCGQIVPASAAKKPASVNVAKVDAVNVDGVKVVAKKPAAVNVDAINAVAIKPDAAKAAVAKPAVAKVNPESGLPEGVKIVPVAGVEPPLIAAVEAVKPVAADVPKSVAAAAPKPAVAEPPKPVVAEPPKPVVADAVKFAPATISKFAPSKVAPLAAPAAVPNPRLAAPLPIVNDLKIPVKRRVGRPKAGPLDAPLSAPAPMLAAPVPMMPTPISLAPKPAAVAPAAKPGVNVPQPAAVPKPAASAPKPATAPQSAAAPKPIAAAPQPTATAARAPQPTGARDDATGVSYMGAGASPWLTLAVLGLAAATATLVLVVAGPNLAGLADKVATGGWNLWSALIAVAILYYYVRGVTAIALAYGEARRGDHRPVPRKHWFSVAINNIGSGQTLDYLSLILQSVPILGIIFLLHFGATLTTGLDPWIAAAALTLAFTILAYLTIILGLAWRLASAALTVGRVNPVKAILLGIGFSLKHPELIIIGLWALVLESLSLAAPLALVAAALSFATSSQLWILAFAAVPLTILGAFAEGASSGSWWQRVYRRLVRHEKLSEALDLLSARSAEKTRPGAAAMFWILLAMIAATVGAWPWLP